VLLPHRRTEPAGPLFGDGLITMQDSDLTTWHAGEPLGQRIVVSGRVLDSGGRPVPDTLIEIWQTNAADRYQHKRTRLPTPIDSNFDGDADGILFIVRFPFPAGMGLTWGFHHGRTAGRDWRE
jgi:protocatechuate 3,4-dioxygenase, beta subunit